MARSRMAVVGALLAALLALVALAAGAPRPLGISQGREHVGAGFFDYVFTTIALAFVAAAAFSLYTVWRLRGKAPVELPRNRWRGSLVFLALLLALGVASRIVHLHPHWLHGGPHRSETPRRHVRTNATDRPGARNAQFQWLEAAIAGALLLAVAGVVVVRRRGEEVDAAMEPEASPAEEVAHALDESLDDLRRESDVRRAVIAAYARMERALASAGLPRRPSEAPLEYLDRALRALAAGADSVRRLTELFERAKFSRHPLGPEAKDEAILALATVRDEVRAAT